MVRSVNSGRVLRAVVALALTAGLVFSTAGVALSDIKVVKAADGNKFKPVHKYITKGDKIRWKNVDNINHTVKATDKKKNWNYFRNLSPGETATRKFGNLGNYTYKCTLHPGMDGVIHVQKP
jgi:plastocyanin